MRKYPNWTAPVLDEVQRQVAPNGAAVLLSMEFLRCGEGAADIEEGRLSRRT